MPKVVLATNGPSDLDEALRAALEQVGQVALASLSPASPIHTLCSGRGADLVIRGEKHRSGFSSNAAERNTLIIYESAVIVGLPVALIYAYAAPWHGEILVEGSLETTWCGEARVAETRVLESIRAEGRGFISQGRLQDELEKEVDHALASGLIREAARCGRFARGGERCSIELH